MTATCGPRHWRATRMSRCAGSCWCRRTNRRAACSPTASRAPTRWRRSSSAGPASGSATTSVRASSTPSGSATSAGRAGRRAASWVSVACSPAPRTSRSSASSQFWMARHGYRGDGAFGQFCIVLPEQDAVVAITGGTESMQTVLDHLWEHLLPALGAEDTVDDAQPELEQRLRGLSLPPAPGRPVPERWDEWLAAPFAAGADLGRRTPRRRPPRGHDRRGGRRADRRGRRRRVAGHSAHRRPG